jgi:hypothetical protein
MPLTNEEFHRLDSARVNSMHLRKGKGQEARVLQLAFEHIEDLSAQQQKAIRVIEGMLAHRNKSLCWRVPRWFAYRWARTVFSIKFLPQNLWLHLTVFWPTSIRRWFK